MASEETPLIINNSGSHTEDTTVIASNGNNYNDDDTAAAVSGNNGNVAGDIISPTTSSLSSGGDPVLNLILQEELDKPWPATFERSISLLSSPVMNQRQADLYTKSPKIGGTPLAHRRARRISADHSTLKHRFGNDDDDFEKGVVKTQSLDFSTRMKGPTDAITIKPLREAQLDQQRKADEAKEYRKKLIAQNKEKGKPKKKLAKEEDMETRATFSQCTFNMSNILMGVGLLELPYACKESGWFGGLFCLLTMGFVTWRTSVLIGRELNGDPRPLYQFFDNDSNTRMLPPITSFPDIARAAYGETGCFVLAAILYFELYSCVAIFFVAVGDHLHTLFPLISKENGILLAGIVSCFPTILLHSARLLSYFSMIGILATISIVMAVFSAAMVEGDISEEIAEATTASDFLQQQEPTHIYWKGQGLPTAMGLMAFCFSGHAIVPSIYSSMRKPQQYEGMITLSYTIVLCSCLLVGGGGYYMFGSQVLDQVTLSLEQHSDAVIVMKILSWLMILTALSKTTLTIFPLALGTEEFVAPYVHSDQMMHVASGIIKLIWTVLALLVAVYVPSFSFICALVGLICTMSVSVIFPAAAHYTLFKSKLSTWEKLLDGVFVVFGMVVAVVGTIATVRQ